LIGWPRFSALPAESAHDCPSSRAARTVSSKTFNATGKPERQSALLPRTRSDTPTLTTTPQSVAESVVAHGPWPEAHATDGECTTAAAPITAASQPDHGPKRVVSALALDCVAGMQSVLKLEMGRIPPEQVHDYTRVRVMGFINRRADRCWLSFGSKSRVLMKCYFPEK
jgi:hypothetical protein